MTIPDLAFTPMEFAVQSRLRYCDTDATTPSLKRISPPASLPLAHSTPAQQ
ncbi:hypothetical protein [Paraburkholderia phytofirmans]|uniref:hypothetical protein n=1 Tax=Paraburkholderia TaxID=1822464 RepID=UPI00131495AF|nr:hypothetical protein [Paraburkholderia phytofirmans]